jgi:hypothetical protein
MKSRGNHVTFFIQTLKVIREQQEAVCRRRDFTEERIIFFSSRVFYGAPCTLVFLPDGKSRALIYLHTFTFILLSIVYASYLSFQNIPNTE